MSILYSRAVTVGTPRATVGTVAAPTPIGIVYLNYGWKANNSKAATLGTIGLNILYSKAAPIATATAGATKTSGTDSEVRGSKAFTESASPEATKTKGTLGTTTLKAPTDDTNLATDSSTRATYLI